MDQPTAPLNSEYQIVEERHYENLFTGNTSNSLIVMKAYAKEIPNVKVVSKKLSKLDKLYEAGLIGCLNNSGITSKNYKNSFFEILE